MPGVRLLLRMAPFVVGAVAASVWLRRRGAARKALAAGVQVRQIEPPRPEIERSRRFEREPIDIVTVVDDLLLAGR